MRLHGNARTTPYIRQLMVHRVLKRAEPVKDTAASFGVSTRTVHKWVRRYRLEGEAGLLDRSSRPDRCPHRTDPQLIRRIQRLRRQRLTAWQISRRLGVPRSTVSRWLARAGMGQLRHLEPKPPVIRYERKRPGALLHLDIKKLARIARPGHRIHGDRSRTVEGVIRTLKEQWAYGACYQTSAHRTRALQPWTNHYSRHRPHTGIGMATPISRLEASP